MVARISVLGVIFLFARVVCDVLGYKVSLKSIAVYGLDVMGVIDKWNEVEQKLQDRQKNFLDNVETATKAITSKFNVLIDVVDDYVIMKYFAKLIPEAHQKGFGNNSCIEGITTKKHHVGTLTLKDGSLYYKTPMDLRVESLEDRGDSKLYNSSFTFADIWVSVSWEFVSSGHFLRRTGTMEMVYKGKNRVSISATVPKSRTYLENMLANHECFMNVEAMDVVLGEEPEIVAVNYNSVVKSWFEKDSLVKSWFGNVQGGTEFIVRGMIEDLEGHMMSQLKKTLKSVVAPATTRTDVFCENPFTTAAPIDCERINDIGEYWIN